MAYRKMEDRTNRVTALGEDITTGQSVLLPYETRDLGVTVLGQTGYGKTTLLEQLILQDIERGTSVVIIDAHGDLTQRVLTLAETDEENLLLLLEAWEDAPFRLNLFECPNPMSAIAVDRTVSGIVQVFKRLFGSPREFYPRLERDLGNAARTVIANNGTLLDVPRLFWDPQFRTAALQRVTNPRVHEFWRLWERIGRADRQLEQLEATINRLDQFLASEFVAQVVGSTESTIPFDEVLDGEGQVLLLSLPVGEIGEGLTNLLGSLFLAVLTERIFARVRLAPGSRPRVHLYLDEYGRYATPTTAQLLTEGRKFGIGTTIAHQTRAQIPDEENRAAELQVGTLICFQLIGEDAQELSGEFHVEPDPQWEERVEEIEGTEPVLAISQNPVEHLLRAGHRDPAVRDLTVRLLGPLQREAVSREPASAARYSEALSLMNEVLVNVMEGRGDLLADHNVQRMTDASLRLLKYLRIDPAVYLVDPIIERISWRSSKLRSRLVEFIHGCLSGSPGTGGASQGKSEVSLEECRQLLVEACLECLSGVHNSAMRPLPVPGRTRGPAPDFVPSEYAGGVRDGTVRLQEMVQDIGTLCEALQRDPILVPSGQEKPRVRVRYITHPQRSYQDVQNELAVQLANLPRFTAYTSIQGEQHQIRLDPPIEARVDEERIARIRWVSKAKFGRLPKPPVPQPEESERQRAGLRIARGHPAEE